MSQCLGYDATIAFLTLLLIMSLLVPAGFAFAQSQTTVGQFPESIIASSSTDATPRLLELRAIQQAGTTTQEVSGFNLDSANTVNAQINSQLLLFVTDELVSIIEAKVRTAASDQFLDLVPLTTTPQATNTFSLANLPAGEYTLDVIAQEGSAKAAYEGILVIDQEPTTVASAPSPTPSSTPGDEDNGEEDEGEEENGEGDEEVEEGGEDEEGDEDEGEDEGEEDDGDGENGDGEEG
jgi:hypothetical protein